MVWCGTGVQGLWCHLVSTGIGNDRLCTCTYIFAIFYSSYFYKLSKLPYFFTETYVCDFSELPVGSTGITLERLRTESGWTEKNIPLPDRGAVPLYVTRNRCRLLCKT
jgi:hypothetical protein